MPIIILIESSAVARVSEASLISHWGSPRRGLIEWGSPRRGLIEWVTAAARTVRYRDRCRVLRREAREARSSPPWCDLSVRPYDSPCKA